MDLSCGKTKAETNGNHAPYFGPQFLHHVGSLRYCFRILNCDINGTAVARRVVPLFVGLISIGSKVISEASMVFTQHIGVQFNRYAHSAGPIVDSLL